jgi:hypothetical protein
LNESTSHEYLAWRPDQIEKIQESSYTGQYTVPIESIVSPNQVGNMYFRAERGPKSKINFHIT